MSNNLPVKVAAGVGAGLLVITHAWIPILIVGGAYGVTKKMAGSSKT